ncbi:hypothetical protein MHL31_01185 [Lutibacter sp. A80]|uniref:hypothetical protein n=1 Tax=Lutibacter sp. A80 TaxID=2918453 RepID=UPI001F054E5D|nr:hypothetical protein [Lutibacter sp. A80]UMB60842.1 hypothetical protein MHL31_01185 [Lutibacter sp. A80]
MKKIIKNIATLCLLFIFITTSYGQIEKSNLKILYVGNNPDKPLSEREISRISSNIDRAKEFRKTRTPDFKQFLHQYFNKVAVVFNDDFKEEMSANYDVTIIDAYLTPYEGGYVKDSTGQITGYETRKFLTENYHDATIMIGEPSAFIGEGRELKIDHLCLCLDAHAHGMKLEHPIFNEPYKINISYEDVKYTGNYKVRYGGRNLGESQPMWRIQTEGYRDGKGFPVGLVSTGYNFDNGIDAEWISSGTCDKGIESTAIGRHANFLHWGFAAAPEYLTESAKLAFINAIHYIAPFKGAEQITRKIKGVQLKKYLREQQWTLSDEGSSRWLAYIAESDKKFNEERKKIQAKKDAGKELTKFEEMSLQMPERKETREWTIRHEPQELKDKFGKDWAAYENYYKENMDYFYPADSVWYVSLVDEDAKSLGIANNDIKLLEKAVKMLTNKEQSETAKRILTRYTKESFETAKEWEQWFTKNHKKLYFSEGDGYKYIVLP